MRDEMNIADAKAMFSGLAEKIAWAEAERPLAPELIASRILTTMTASMLQNDGQLVEKDRRTIVDIVSAVGAQPDPKGVGDIGLMLLILCEAFATYIITSCNDDMDRSIHDGPPTHDKNFQLKVKTITAALTGMIMSSLEWEHDPPEDDDPDGLDKGDRP